MKSPMTVEQVFSLIPPDAAIARIERDDCEECIAMTEEGGVYEGRPVVTVTFTLPPYQVRRPY
jgi:hypothetical protein